MNDVLWSHEVATCLSGMGWLIASKDDKVSSGVPTDDFTRFVVLAERATNKKLVLVAGHWTAIGRSSEGSPDQQMEVSLYPSGTITRQGGVAVSFTGTCADKVLVNGLANLKEIVEAFLRE